MATFLLGVAAGWMLASLTIFVSFLYALTRL